MDKHHQELLATRALFYRRLLKHTGFALLLIALSLTMGILGYHFIAKLSWIDAFLDAAMILSGMGPVSQLSSDSAKLFAGIYAIYSGLLFISLVAIILIPVWHHVLHRFHIATKKEE